MHRKRRVEGSCVWWVGQAAVYAPLLLYTHHSECRGEGPCVWWVGQAVASHRERAQHIKLWGRGRVGGASAEEQPLSVGRRELAACAPMNFMFTIN